MSWFDIPIDFPALGAIAAGSWFIWQRYNALENRLRKIEGECVEFRHKNELAMARLDGQIYRLNSAVMTLSKALDRYIPEYEPRHESGWAGDDPPSEFK